MLRITPADENAVRLQLVVAINVPHIVWTVAVVCSVTQSVMLSCYNTYRVQLPQHQPDDFM